MKRPFETGVARTGTSIESGRHFLSLDGMRGVAAISVLLFHRRELGFPRLLGHGYLGVDFFFMLSGFVIACAYERRLVERRLTLVAFAVTRFIRLMPLLALGVAFGLADAILNALAAHWLGGVIRAVASVPLALIPLPSPLLLLPWLLDGPSWSLFFELVANFVYAACARRLSGRRLGVALAAAAATLLAYVLHRNTVNFGREWDLAAGVLRVGFPFLAGILLLRLHRAGRLRRVGLPIWLLSVVLVGALSMPLLPAPWNGAYDGAVILLLFPALVASASAHEPQGRWVRLVGLSAALSYPVYILHWPMMELIEQVPGQTALPGWVRLAMIVGIVLPVAWAAGRWYDEPMRRHLRCRFAALTSGR